MKIKIALINPQTDTDNMRAIYGYHENLAIGCIASNLKACGCEVYLLDLSVHKLNEYQITNMLIKNNIQLIGLSVNYATLPSAIKIAHLLKLQLDCIIVLGGEHATYLDKEILEEYSVIDYIIRGEGEITFLDLVKHLINNDPVTFIAGISYIDKKTGKFIRTPNRDCVKDLDSLPFASRDISEYALRHNIPIEVGILAQRGCPFACSFCNANRFLSNEDTILRTRSPLNVINEMETLLPLFENRNLILHFYDATFITSSVNNRKWINEFCSLLKYRNIKIPFDIFIRSDSFNFENDNDLILRLKNVGLIGTYVGLEAGDDTTLHVYHKGIHVNNSVQTMDHLRRHGIEGSTNGFICFYQEVSLEEIIRSIKFLRHLRFCSLWNIASRTEMLPGINLEKEMTLTQRKTLWDVENYNIINSKVSILYSMLNTIKTKFYIAQYEDYLSRKLRDIVKLELFYSNDNSLLTTSNKLENDIYKLQTITYNFILDLIYDINIDETIDYNKYNPNIQIYINNMICSLACLYKKYSWLFDKYNINFTMIEKVG